jgi:Zn-dependent M28 family amino/carboxypeptidase
MRSQHPFVILTILLLGLTGACTDEGDSPTSELEPALTLQLPDAAAAAANAIDEATLQSIVAVLSSDEMAGRGPATEGDRAARKYIAEFLADQGAQPGAADGSWEQPLGLISVTSAMPETWTFRTDSESVDLAWWDEYVASSAVQDDAAAVDDAELVFVGYGIVAPEEDWDDFKGADLTGKILLMLNNDPDWDPEMFAGERRLYYGRWTYKYESAARQGAAGVIIIHTTPSAGYGFTVVQNGWSGPQFQLPAGDGPKIAFEGWATEEAARKVVAIGGFDLDELVESARSRDFAPVSLGITTSLAFTNEVDREALSANVLGLIPGRDPDVADELVIYTAHHDHMGIGKADEDGDAIYNGARDNASGCATIMGVAKAFAALPEAPRRSILFLLVGAEEQGLLGSKWYAQNPTVHPGKIAANINIDSAAIFGAARDVGVIGKGKSELEELLVQAAARQNRVVVDEPFPDKGYYYRSDQFNFAKIGVPALYFKAGTDSIAHGQEWGREAEDRWRAERYHQPGDEIYDEWDFGGMVEDARLAFWVGLHVANIDETPGWKPGDEFEAIRQQMLAESPD